MSLAPELVPRLKIALRAAETAGAILMSHFAERTRPGKRLIADEKSSIDLVTAADRASEACILGELRAAFPDDALLGEEQDGKDAIARIAAAQRADPARLCWVVDPLDGTTNFAHGHLQFGVSIGLLRGTEPVLGVVFAPARREIFVGGEGLRATCNGEGIGVSGIGALEQALLGTGFPYDRRDHLPALLARVGEALRCSQGVRRAGSAALDLCELAAGRLDGFWEERLAPWDLTAGCAILDAAGGRRTDAGGAAHDVFGAATVASNGLVHGALLELLAIADAEAASRAR
ncbi:MAG: Inositol-monophosphatase [Pseudomonadota bacterium]|jgi:myo-inositol-1(or 4)-monophosphatase